MAGHSYKINFVHSKYDNTLNPLDIIYIRASTSEPVVLAGTRFKTYHMTKITKLQGEIVRRIVTDIYNDALFERYPFAEDLEALLLSELTALTEAIVAEGVEVIEKIETPNRKSWERENVIYNSGYNCARSDATSALQSLIKQ